MRKYGRTDEANSRFPQLCEGAFKSKAILLGLDDFYIHAVHLDIIKVFFYPLPANVENMMSSK
jgi:hypothetical protein